MRDDPPAHLRAGPPPATTNELTCEDGHSVTATVVGDAGYVAANPRTVTFDVEGTNPQSPCGVTTGTEGDAPYTYTVPRDPDSLGVDRRGRSLARHRKGGRSGVRRRRIGQPGGRSLVPGATVPEVGLRPSGRGRAGYLMGAAATAAVSIR